MNYLEFLLERLQNVCDMQLVKIVNGGGTNLRDKKEVLKNTRSSLKF